MTLDVSPGDVLAVNTSGFWNHVVRFGEWLQGRSSLAGHVVIVISQDQTGRWMGIQGQPGGVGPCDVTPYLSRSSTRANHAQPRPDDNGQLASFLASCAKSLGISYDWVGIAEDTLNIIGLHDLSEDIDWLWRWPTKTNLLPGHVVCSSIAARLYEVVGWAHPDMGTERVCEPADWWQWSDKQQWLQ